MGIVCWTLLRRNRGYRFGFVFGPWIVCRSFLMWALGIRKHFFQVLEAWVRTRKVTRRIHGNVGRHPGHAVTSEKEANLIKFIAAVSDTHALPNPGKTGAELSLPTELSMGSLYRHQFFPSVRGVSLELSLSSFKRLWR